MARHPDPAFMESINIHMRVPERLSVAPGPGSGLASEEGGAVYAMNIPDRLTYAETPDLSPRPSFKPTSGVPLGLEPCWEGVCGEAWSREGLQSPIRRSYSDQSFGRTPPGTPTHLKQTLAVSRPPSSSPAAGPPPHLLSELPPPPPPSLPSLLSPHSLLQTARQLGQQASQRLLQTVNQKYSRFRNDEQPPAPGVAPQVPASRLVEPGKTRTMTNWSPEEEGGAVVELIILRRQVMKMSRRLAALERHSADHRNTEVLLLSVLVSACLLNAWLWLRR